MATPVNDSYSAASGSVIAGGRSYAPDGYAVTITTPAQYKMHQRNESNLANVVITGTYTGSPTKIEARFNGGAWTTIVASPAGGTYSGSLANCPTGQGLLEVRFANAHGITASKTHVGVGDIWIVSGQSNNRGQANAAIQPANANSTAVQYDASGNWIALAFTANTSNANYLGRLASYIDAKGVPVGFVNCSIGATNIATWVVGTAKYNAMLARANAVGGSAGLLWWQGESDTAMAQATYEGYLNNIINGWFADTGKKTLIQKLCLSGLDGGANTIRAAQSAVGASNTHVLGVSDMNVWSVSGVHYSTTQEVNDVAAAVWAALEPVAYP